jgi:ADP-ribosylglycohydrolase
VPLAVAAFVYGQGEPRSIPVCCMLGRDCDSTATTVGAWVGALHGVSGLPEEWVDPVCTVNVHEIDIRGLAEQLVGLAAQNRA